MSESPDQHPLSDEMELLGYGSSYKTTLCEMLEGIQLFTDFSSREIETLADYVQAYRAPAGTSIFTEGQRSPFLCLLVEGRLDVRKERTPGEQRSIATVRAGKSVGEMAFIDGQPHSATVVATQEASLLVLGKLGFENISEEHPRLALKVLWQLTRLISHRLRQTSGVLVDHLA